MMIHAFITVQTKLALSYAKEDKRLQHTSHIGLWLCVAMGYRLSYGTC